MRIYNKGWVYFPLTVILLTVPFIGLGASLDFKKEYAAQTIPINDFINPDKWFDILKRNITIPISKENIVSIPTPEEALKQSSPQLREIGRGVQEETGIDLAKFIGWMAKTLKLFFQIVINLLENVARSFS